MDTQTDLWKSRIYYLWISGKVSFVSPACKSKGGFSVHVKLYFLGIGSQFYSVYF